MGSIALLARELGHQVSGSDENVYPPMSDQLRDAGIDLRSPYGAGNIDDPELVIVGNANLPRGNPELEAVLDRGIPYTSGAEWLGRYLLNDRWVIAVAGTHGKTTTSSMIAWILEHAGQDPGFLIGGVPHDFPRSARLGSGPFFVIEADEYDTSYFDRRAKFLHYRPRTAVLNNLEFDHADIYPNLQAIQEQFHLLIRTIPGSGLIIHPDNDANIAEVLDRGCWTPCLRLGKDISANTLVADGSEFDVIVEGQSPGTVRWPLTGAHNVHNALAAIAAARHAGVTPALACSALGNFHGVKRRMEVIYDRSGVKIYDDFAHHPTAIDTTLAGLRKRVGKETILAIIEPGSHTMRQGIHRDTLKASAAGADHLIWYKPANVKWNMQVLAGNNASIIEDIEDIVRATGDLVRSGTVRHVVIMSNSGFGGLHARLTARIADLHDAMDSGKA